MYFAFEIDPPGQGSTSVFKALVMGLTYLPDGVTMTR